MKKQLITSALPYVNNVPHLGNIIGSVLSADVYARFNRLRHNETLFICGTDEYGTTTEIKACQEGVSPQELCNKYHALHLAIYEWFNISFDYFGRTSTSMQTHIAGNIFMELYNNDHLFSVETNQLYSVTSDRFLADRYVRGTCPKCYFDAANGDQCEHCGSLLESTELIDPICILTNTHPVLKQTKHIYLNLPVLQDTLFSYFKRVSSYGNWSNNAIQITNSWLKEKLKSRAITRDLVWGTPVPKNIEGYEKKTLYVWFDAPIGYISITANFTNDWKSWWQNPKNVNLTCFMGKDNVPFHTIMFPASLIGTNTSWTLPTSIIATEYISFENKKFSKSKNIGIFGDDVIKSGIPADVWRYYLLSIRPESSDSTFKLSDFQAKNNSDLVNNLGNFVNRVITFLNANYDAATPSEINCTIPQSVLVISIKLQNKLKLIVNLLNKCQLKKALNEVLHISALGNKFLQETQPFLLIKSTNENDKKICDCIMSTSIGIVYVLSLTLEPFLPSTSVKILNMLNLQHSILNLTDKFIEKTITPYRLLPPCHKLSGVKCLLFQRISNNEITNLSFVGS